MSNGGFHAKKQVRTAVLWAAIKSGKTISKTTIQFINLKFGISVLHALVHNALRHEQRRPTLVGLLPSQRLP